MSLQTKLDETISNAEKYLKSFSAQPLRKYTKEFVDFCQDPVKNCPDWVVTISEYNDTKAVISCIYTYTISRTYRSSTGKSIAKVQANLEINISEDRIVIQYLSPLYLELGMNKLRNAVFDFGTDTKLEGEHNPRKQAAELLSYLYYL